MQAFDFDTYCLERLYSVIPEIKQTEGELKKRLEDVLEEAHSIYERVFCYLIAFLIKKESRTSSEQELMDRSFKLIEELAHHEDFEVRCVAEVSFIEPLLCEVKPMKEIEKYLLPKSIEMARDVASTRFGRDPYTWEERKL